MKFHNGPEMGSYGGRVRLISYNPIRRTERDTPKAIPDTYGIGRLKKEVARPIKGLRARWKRWRLVEAWKRVFPYLNEYEHPGDTVTIDDYVAMDFDQDKLLQEIGNHAELIYQLVHEAPDTILVGKDIMDKLYRVSKPFYGSYTVDHRTDAALAVNRVYGEGDMVQDKYTLYGMKVIFLPYMDRLVLFRSNK